MSFLRARRPKTEIPQFTGLQIQTSSNAVPIPIVYGVNKVAPNIVWAGDFRSQPQYTKAGGKGGGRRTLSGYKYSTAILLGLCEGPITAVGTIWKGQSTYTPWGLNLYVYYGTQSQAAFGHIATVDPSQSLAYRGLAYAASGHFDLGESASLGSLQFEVYGAKYQTAAVNARDADPAEVVYDFLTNAQYGVGFPAGAIDGTTLFGSSGGSSYQAYCQAVGIAFSPVLTNKETANAILTRWLTLTNTAAVWSAGKLKFIPYGDTSVTGRLYSGLDITFNPHLAPIYDLTEEDFVVDDNEDPILVERKDPYSLYNLQPIEVSYRGNGYNSMIVSVWDQNAIETYGLRTGPSVSAHEICERGIAQKVGQLILQRHLYVRTTYSFRLSFEYCLLEPMDIVTLTDAALGLANSPVRIVSLEEDENGILEVTAEEFPGAVGTAVAYPVEVSRPTVLDHSIVPSAVNPPVIFEPPASLTGGTSEVWVAVSGGLMSAWKLTEDSTTGFHFAFKTMPSEAAGTAIEFRSFVQAAERANCLLQMWNGSAYEYATFDLLAGTVQSTTAGITSSSVAVVGSGPWFEIAVSTTMMSTANPIVYIMLTDSTGNNHYPGTSGNGLYVWGPRFASGGVAPSMMQMPIPASGAGLDDASVVTPEGIEGHFDPYWGGCLVHISTDNVTFGQIGQINAPARHGLVSAALASSDGTLSVDLNESGGGLGAATFADAQNGVTLSLVGNELLAYGGVMLTVPGPHTYDLTNLVRGLYGTVVPSTHGSGTRFVRLDDAIFKYVLPPAYIGQTLYMKFQSFNIFGEALQDLSTCVTYTYVPSGAGAGIGPVASALAVGSTLDYGATRESVTTAEDFGLVADANVTVLDLGGMV